MSYHVVHCGIASENFGIMTSSTYESKEAHEKWMKGRMLDGTDRPLSSVYKCVFGSGDYEEVRAFLDEHEEETKPWKLRSELRQLQELAETLDEGEKLPDFAVDMHILRALI